MTVLPHLGSMLIGMLQAQGALGNPETALTNVSGPVDTK